MDDGLEERLVQTAASWSCDLTGDVLWSNFREHRGTKCFCYAYCSWRYSTTCFPRGCVESRSMAILFRLRTIHSERHQNDWPTRRRIFSPNGQGQAEFASRPAAGMFMMVCPSLRGVSYSAASVGSCYRQLRLWREENQL